MERTPTYNSWKGMKQRCLNPNDPSFARYGGRGITVCERWQKSFLDFLEDMGERPPGTTIDRIDPSGNYEPSNCRWADAATQQANKRGVIFSGEALERAIELRKAGMTYREIDRIFGTTYGVAWSALKLVRGL